MIDLWNGQFSQSSDVQLHRDERQRNSGGLDSLALSEGRIPRVWLVALEDCREKQQFKIALEKASDTSAGLFEHSPSSLWEEDYSL